LARIGRARKGTIGDCYIEALIESESGYKNLIIQRQANRICDAPSRAIGLRDDPLLLNLDRMRRKRNRQK
jgi:hypothetical protein